MLNKMRNNPAMVIMNSNHVTEQLVADAISYLGGSPLANDDERDDETLVGLASAVVINMGTTKKESHERALRLGKVAKKLGKPVVFDPVGAGASNLRRLNAIDTMKQVQPEVVRGNLSEIAALLMNEQSALGIDSTSHANAVQVAKAYAKQEEVWVVISGEVDVVTDGETVYELRNGHPYLSVNVGMGDVLDAILALGLAHGVSLEDLAKVASILTVAADLAIERDDVHGPATFRNAVFDYLATLSDATLAKLANIKVL
ncbi:hypothetical protein G6R29_00535 [Fructobacillus sp. M2-14]|uniref:hydroxyethylthiazole kinase n=1 Tax=Fructobacillus broussonetiae TaxID=2713173 RepID=A0ABS5QY55_9LACO|nr:hydroxyethylthiazole kinase [Fructobacillus broussonetiae]MBS9338124.1 hypothetical protein [Fructobacillus broussonetiae]